MFFKKTKTFSLILGSISIGLTGSQANEVVKFSKGSVSDTRYELIAKNNMDMRCGKSMRGKIEECKKLMEEASCGKEVKECKKLIKNQKEMACGECGAKIKEMVCGSKK